MRGPSERTTGQTQPAAPHRDAPCRNAGHRRLGRRPQPAPRRRGSRRRVGAGGGVRRHLSARWDRLLEAQQLHCGGGKGGGRAWVVRRRVGLRVSPRPRPCAARMLCVARAGARRGAGAAGCCLQGRADPVGARHCSPSKMRVALLWGWGEGGANGGEARQGWWGVPAAEGACQVRSGAPVRQQLQLCGQHPAHSGHSGRTRPLALARATHGGITPPAPRAP